MVNKKEIRSLIAEERPFIRLSDTELLVVLHSADCLYEQAERTKDLVLKNALMLTAIKSLRDFNLELALRN